MPQRQEPFLPHICISHTLKVPDTMEETVQILSCYEHYYTKHYTKHSLCHAWRNWSRHSWFSNHFRQGSLCSNEILQKPKFIMWIKQIKLLLWVQSVFLTLPRYFPIRSNKDAWLWGTQLERKQLPGKAVRKVLLSLPATPVKSQHWVVVCRWLSMVQANQWWKMQSSNSVFPHLTAEWTECHCHGSCHCFMLMSWA